MSCISPSRVTLYLLCPRKYKFRYLEKRVQERISANFVLGSAVHAAIEWWQRRRIEGTEVELRHVLAIFRADWFGGTNGLEIDYGKREAASYKETGLGLVELYVQRFNGEEPPDDVELGLEAEVPDVVNGGVLPAPLLGYIDASKGNVITEVKTAARKNAVWHWGLQLAAYSFAWREKTGVRPRMRVVQLIKTKDAKIEVDELMLSDRDEAWMLEVFSEVHDAVRRGAFPPNKSWMCPSCEYRDACGVP